MTDPRLIPDFNNPAKAMENKHKYRSFDHRRLHAPFYTALKAMIDNARSVAETTRVLDVGSGSGENAYLMADMGAQVVAVEPAPEMRRLGADFYAHERIQLVNDALPSLSAIRPVGSGDKFDAVLISAALQYVAPEHLAEALESIAEVTKPGGLIRITYPTPPSREHQHAIPPERFKQAVAEANAVLPASMRLQITGEDASLASDGRTALTGEPLQFVEFTLKLNSHGQVAKPRDIVARPATNMSAA